MKRKRKALGGSRTMLTIWTEIKESRGVPTPRACAVWQDSPTYVICANGSTESKAMKQLFANLAKTTGND